MNTPTNNNVEVELQCAYEKCKYGKAMFMHTRFGLLDCNESLNEIIKNRDEFIENNKIKKIITSQKYTKYHIEYIKIMKKRHENFMQNIEIYQDDSKDFIILVTPYGDNINVNISYTVLTNMFTPQLNTYMIKLSKNDIVLYNKYNNKL